MQGKKVLIAVTGSIAAYKIILLVRLLTKAGVEVKIVMTPAAKEFVSPLVLSTLTKNEVLVGLSTEEQWANHVMLGRWADVMLVAPLTCNTLAKMATGICDNLVLATYFSATCPVVVAPAMDEDMWLHPATVNNIRTLVTYGVHVLQVNMGELASGLVGPGRMAEPEEMMAFLQQFFVKTTGENLPLTGLKALLTAGPTYEPIDPVRFIGNHSSGKMGIALANELQRQGAEVHLVLGPSHLRPQKEVVIHPVTTAVEMQTEVMKWFETSDIIIMAAAVADYRPEEPALQKIKKREDSLEIKLVKNPDILKTCGQRKKDSQILVGFALETNNAVENAKEKLISKNADLLILNMAGRKGEGFASDTNKVSIFDKNGTVQQLELMPKEQVAQKIVSYIIQKRNEIS